MTNINYGNKEYSLNTEALASLGEDWKAIFYKGYGDRNFKSFHGTREEIEAICNAGSSRLEEYTAERITKHPDDMPSGLEGPGFWAVTCDSDEGEQFDDFWRAAEHIITDDKQNGGTWTAGELVTALASQSPQTCFAMIEALMSIGTINEVEA